MQESGAGMQGQGPWQSTPRELAGWDPSNLRKTQWHQGWGNAKEDIQTCTCISHQVHVAITCSIVPIKTPGGRDLQVET